MVNDHIGEIGADQNLRAALDTALEELSGVYDAETLIKLKSALGSKLAQSSGTNLQELTDAVQNIPAFKDREKAELIAKTVSYQASNLANKRAWQQSGVVKSLKWLTAEDADICEFCAALDGKIIGVSSNFLKRGETIRGKDGAIMSTAKDIETPPLHDGCRCYCRPESVSLDE